MEMLNRELHDHALEGATVRNFDIERRSVYPAHMAAGCNI